jgi:hypothetical protein
MIVGGGETPSHVSFATISLSSLSLGNRPVCSAWEKPRSIGGVPSPHAKTTIPAAVNMDIGRYGAASCIIDDHIYVTGGYIGSSNTASSEQMCRYHIETGERQSRAPMHVPRSWPVYTIHDHHFYVGGL